MPDIYKQCVSTDEKIVASMKNCQMKSLAQFNCEYFLINELILCVCVLHDIWVEVTEQLDFLCGSLNKNGPIGPQGVALLGVVLLE